MKIFKTNVIVAEVDSLVKERDEQKRKIEELEEIIRNNQNRSRKEDRGYKAEAREGDSKLISPMSSASYSDSDGESNGSSYFSANGMTKVQPTRSRRIRRPQGNKVVPNH